nr:MAG TPA: hypothetical protein [Caudoviricetes sp.]
MLLNSPHTVVKSSKTYANSLDYNIILLYNRSWKAIYFDRFGRTGQYATKCIFIQLFDSQFKKNQKEIANGFGRSPIAKRL